MIKKQKNRIEIKRHLTIIVALVCVVSFVAVFLLSSAHFTNHAHGHADSAGVSANTCQRTLSPVCECGTEVPFMQVQTQAKSGINSHAHSEMHTDCSVCVFIQKTVNQVRQFSASTATVILTDTNIFALFALCVFFALVGLSTPVKLKNKTTN